jgi:hypothetical protein
MEGNLLEMMEYILSMLTSLNQKVKEGIDNIRSNVESSKQARPYVNTAESIGKSSLGKRSSTYSDTWEPAFVKKTRIRMFNDVGSELHDEDIRKELYTRQKVKAYHLIKETLPHLFEDPNKCLPQNQFEIHDHELRVVDNEDPGKEVKLLTA